MREPGVRHFLTIIALLASASALAAGEAAAPDQPVYAIESSKASRSLLLDVTQAGSRLVAVGDHGHILYSDDQGQHWQQARVPTRQLLTAVFFVDAQHGWAVGHDAQVLASDDGGQTWVKQFEDLKREAPLLDVWFENTRRGFAVGAYGTLLSTDDGGQHWQDVSEQLDNPDQFHLNAIAAIKDGGLFIVGEAGSLYRSRDLGQSWERLESPYQGSLFGVTGTARVDTLLIFGLRGNVLRSEDGGDSWSPVLVQGERGPLESTLTNASLQADGSLLLVGNGGSVLRSTDDGASFSVSNRPDRMSLAAVTTNAQGELVVVGQGGVYLGAPQGSERQAAIKK